VKDDSTGDAIRVAAGSRLKLKSLSCSPHPTTTAPPTTKTGEKMCERASEGEE